MKKYFIVLFLTLFCFVLFSPVFSAAKVLNNSRNFGTDSLTIELPRSVVAGIPFSVKITINREFLQKFNSVSIWVITSDPNVCAAHPFTFKRDGFNTKSLTLVENKSGILIVRAFIVSQPEYSVSKKINVVPGKPEHIRLNTNEMVIGIGQTKQISAVVTDRFGNLIQGIPIKWSVYTQNGGYVNVENGLVKGIRQGKCLLVAQYANLKEVCIVSVRKSVITNLEVKLTPDTTHSYPLYTLIFKGGNILHKRGSPLYIVFSDKFMFPCPCHKHIKGSEILVNGVACDKDPKIFYEPRALEIFLPQDIKPNENVKITIASSSEIKTPPVPGKYRIGVAFSLDQIPIFVNVAVRFIGISNISVTLNPNITGCYSDWKIVFKLKNGSSIKQNDEILLFFPIQFTLPDSIDSSRIKVNGKKVRAIAVSNNLHFIKILSPVSVGENGKLTISIEKSAGIINSYAPGEYKIKLLYPDSVYPIISVPFSLKFVPVIKISYLIKGRKGSAGFYNSKVILEFDTFSNIPNDTVNVYYSVNFLNPVLYKEKITLSDGDYTINYFGDDTYGVKIPTEQLSIKIDTTPPSIVLKEDNSDSVISTHMKYYRISGFVSKDTEILYVNGIKTEITTNYEFNQLVTLRPGKNMIEIMAKDYAGNTTVKMLKVVYVPVKQFLRVTPESNVFFGFTDENFVNLKIETNLGSVLTIVTSSDVEMFKMYKCNTFYYRIPLRFGRNVIEIISRDVNGDSLSKTIEIEKVDDLKILYVCSEKLNKRHGLNWIREKIAVKIRNNRCFVSAKTLSEMLGENVYFNEDEIILPSLNLVINFKENNLVLNGKVYIFPKGQKPFIGKKDDVYLPLRFIAETLGYKVVWISHYKVVIIFR